MKNKLALHGGKPVREAVLPYGRQQIDDADIAAVTEILRSDWLTTGPMIPEFEAAFAAATGSKEAVAVSNGTAALHAALFALGVGAGDEVIVTPMTFAASANAALYLRAKPVFADVDPETLLLDPETIPARISPRTKAIVAVDYAGQPCDYDAIYAVADAHGLAVLDDACHAIGGSYKGRPVGSLADVNTFSLHPVKHMTTGEGGMITTDDAEMAQKMRVFRNHGITTDHRQRAEQGGFFYEMVDLGFNYRLTDFQAALGISQLRKLPGWVTRRQEIARQYDRAFAEMDGVVPLTVREDVEHGYHLYMVQFELEKLQADRAEIFSALRAEGIGVNVHYIPVHLHPYYQQKLGTAPGDCPVAEAAYERLVTLPVFPQMGDGDVGDVSTAVAKVLEAYRL
jgi:perosamine synthetase